MNFGQEGLLAFSLDKSQLLASHKMYADLSGALHHVYWRKDQRIPINTLARVEKKTDLCYEGKLRKSAIQFTRETP